MSGDLSRLKNRAAAARLKMTMRRVGKLTAAMTRLRNVLEQSCASTGGVLDDVFDGIAGWDWGVDARIDERLVDVVERTATIQSVIDQIDGAYHAAKAKAAQEEERGDA
jgi:hypothetical protein